MRMTTIFDVLVEPNRRRILDLLYIEQRSVNELVEALGISQPSVSKHLRLLKAAGLVQVRQDAQRRVYTLQIEPLMELEAWLAPYRRKWAQTLDALERHLDAPETTREITEESAPHNLHASHVSGAASARGATTAIKKGETDEQGK